LTHCNRLIGGLRGDRRSSGGGVYSECRLNAGYTAGAVFDYDVKFGTAVGGRSHRRGVAGGCRATDVGAVLAPLKSNGCGAAGRYAERSRLASRDRDAQRLHRQRGRERIGSTAGIRQARTTSDTNRAQDGSQLKSENRSAHEFHPWIDSSGWTWEAATSRKGKSTHWCCQSLDYPLTP